MVDDRFCANTVHYNVDIAYLKINKKVNMDNILIKVGYFKLNMKYVEC